MVANGVLAITEIDWLNIPHDDLEIFCMFGCPATFTTGQLPEGRYGDELVGRVEPVLIPVARLASMPQGLEESTLPWFVGRIKVDLDIKGMSGCPIYGFRKMPDGSLKYWIIALQSRRGRNEHREIVLGCPIDVFSNLLMHEIDHAE